MIFFDSAQDIPNQLNIINYQEYEKSKFVFFTYCLRFTGRM